MSQEDDDNPDWDDIIPEHFRKEMEEKQRMRELEDMYLPPRRKTQAKNHAQEASHSSTHTSSSKRERGSGGKKRKKAKVEVVSDEEDEDAAAASEESENEDRPRKRGRPSNKERLLNFTDAELRRFIKSYKKFPAPLKRLDSIASDADLTDKSQNELRKLGELLRKRCVAFMADHKDIEPPANEVKKRGARAGFSVKFGGASFNAKTLWTCEEELRPLDEVVPSGRDDRQRWMLEFKTRPANFDVDWGQREDSHLLVGIYQYGMGSWDAMKADGALELADKILVEGEMKPQAKHLQTRAEYLLKVIRKNLDLRKNGKKVRKPRKNKVKTDQAATAAAAAVAVTTAAGGSRDGNQSLDDISSSNDDKKESPGGGGGGNSHFGGTMATAAARKEMGDSLATADLHHNHHHHHPNSNASLTMDENSRDGTMTCPREKQRKLVKKEKRKARNSEGPMHFTANNEPRALTVLGDLDPTVFNECKEKMRPVKKALKALDNPDQSLSAPEQVAHTTECLLSIGKQIDESLRVYTDAERVKEWRSNLWYFVSKFTEFDANKLFKLYKRALKKSTGEVDGEEQDAEPRAGGSGSHHNGGGAGSDTDAKEMRSFNKKSSHYAEASEKRLKHEERRKWDEYSDMEGGSKHRSRGSEAGSPLHSARHAAPTDRGRVPLPYPADGHREARPYPEDRWR